MIWFLFGSVSKWSFIALHLLQYSFSRNNSLLSRIIPTGRKFHFYYYTNIFVFLFTSWTTDIDINTNTSTSREKITLLF